MLLAIIASRFPAFVAPANLVNVFNDTSPLIILAIGQALVILTRCIDLSVAANLALTGMVCAMLNVAVPDLPIAAILMVRDRLGAVMGAINGLLVWKLAIPAHRGHARHDDDLPGHHLPDFGWGMGQRARDERVLHRLSPVRSFWASRC